MTFDDNIDESLKSKKLKLSHDDYSAERYPVSRFGALLAASLLNLPGDIEFRMIEEYRLLRQH